MGKVKNFIINKFSFIHKTFIIFIYSKVLININKYKSFFNIKFENKFPKIIVHEKFRKQTKFINRMIVLIGILSSVFVFPTWYFSLMFSIIVFSVGWLFENTIFRFTSIFVTPLPDFTYDSLEWNAMGYMYIPNNVTSPSFFGPAFNTKEYAINIFKLFLSWNYNKQEDNENNICISFIEEKDNLYSVYLYCNPKRKSVNEFTKRIEKMEENKGKDHHSLLVHMILCHRFPISANSNFIKWKKLFLAGQPACLSVFLFDKSTQVTSPIDEINPIRILNIKFKKRNELNRKDIEYQHGKETFGV